MYKKYQKWWSPHLNQDVELNVYGEGGKPAIVFPSSGGSFHEYEDFGMVEACKPFIEEGKLQLYTVGSIDKQTWLNEDAHPSERARRNNDYDCHIIREVIPFIRNNNKEYTSYLATGCSLGAYHAMNFFLKHPDVFDSVISLSGVYSLNSLIGDYMDSNVYLNTPLDYLPNLEDPWFLDRIKQGKIVVCAGQGAWEEEVLQDTYQLKGIMEKKSIPCWFDIWGQDVNHDWPWWKKQMPYFLDHIL